MSRIRVSTVIRLLTGSVLIAGSAFLAAASSEPFPEVRPATRADAVELVSRVTHAPAPCLTPGIQRVRAFPRRVPAARARMLLESPIRLVAESKTVAPGLLSVRFTGEPGSPDHVEVEELDGDGLPPTVAAALEGVQRARHLLLTELGLAEPRQVDLVLAALPEPFTGYTILPDASTERTGIVLSAAPRGGPDETRRAAIHQYAHAVAATAGGAIPAEWSEAFATWAVLAVEGQPDPRTLELLTERLHRLGAGLDHAGLELAPGNALWLSFLERNYGRASVGVTLDELTRGRPVAAALDRAVRRINGHSLSAALREFHLWTVLTGPRSDGLHFAFGAEFDPPPFASTVDGLPALAVLADPPVAGLGLTQVLLRPDTNAGGLQVHFEGDLPALWEADLLLVDREGLLRRVRLDLGPDGRGDETVPLQNVAEAILLVRSLSTDLGALRHRYSYGAHFERSYPYELSLLEAARQDEPGDGVLISWETDSERQLIGFNVLREQQDGEQTHTLNPVWIPALGSRFRPTAYRFVDLTAEADVGYLYRLQGITSNGLTHLSEPVTVPPAEPRR